MSLNKVIFLLQTKFNRLRLARMLRTKPLLLNGIRIATITIAPTRRNLIISMSFMLSIFETFLTYD